MLRLLAAVCCAVLSLASSPLSATAADFFSHRAHASRMYVYPEPRYRGCPDRLSCYSLYGAYGPYGGAAYWSAYSPGGGSYYSPLK